MAGALMNAHRLGLGLGLLLLAAVGCSAPMALGEKRATPGPSLEGVQRAEIVRVAKRHLGVPYAWGGASPSGFDCSGFVKYVYSAVGIAIPHDVARQYPYGTPVSKLLVLQQRILVGSATARASGTIKVASVSSSEMARATA